MYVHVNMYHMSAQGVDVRMIIVHYYYSASATFMKANSNSVCGSNFFNNNTAQVTEDDIHESHFLVHTDKQVFPHHVTIYGTLN